MMVFLVKLGFCLVSPGLCLCLWEFCLFSSRLSGSDFIHRPSLYSNLSLVPGERYGSRRYLPQVHSFLRILCDRAAFPSAGFCLFSQRSHTEGAWGCFCIFFSDPLNHICTYPIVLCRVFFLNHSSFVPWNSGLWCLLFWDYCPGWFLPFWVFQVPFKF